MGIPAILKVDSVELPQLPDVRRPDRLPSLPAWLACRIASLKNESQPDQSGKWREVPTLPASLILKAVEREALALHISDLNALCAQTPANDVQAEQATLLVLTKMFLVLPAPTQTDLSAEARGEAFLAALDDIPAWATGAAVRRWYRGEAGENERGQPYDCHWCPAPADLRSIALAETWRVMGRAKLLARLLRAELLIEHTEEHCQRMRGKLAHLFRNFGSSPLVGKDGSSGAVGEARPMAPTVGPDQGAARPQA